MCIRDSIDLAQIDPAEYADYLVHTLHMAWNTARLAAEKHKRRQKFQHDAAIKGKSTHNFVVGDLVLLKDMKRAQQKQPNIFRGPFPILEIQGDIFKLDTSGTRLLPIVPLSRIKKYNKRRSDVCSPDIDDTTNVGLQEIPAGADNIRGEDISDRYYPIKNIIGAKRIKGAQHYLCDWEGDYSPSYEPASNLSPDLLEDAKRKFG